jgi:hypothetical protein
MNLALWALIAIYAFSRVLQVFPGPVPVLAVVALHVLPPAIFAWMHGARVYGQRGMLVFFAVAGDGVPRDGLPGAYFGVPVSNFRGWYLTVFCFYQWFALYSRGREAGQRPARVYWRLPVVFYAASAAGNLLLAIPRPGPPVVSDPAGVVWRVSDITSACVLVSVFVMGAFAMMAWVRLAER